jgi:outer membrane protein OmpA-like peptidoglycan-associated protein
MLAPWQRLALATALAWPGSGALAAAEIPTVAAERVPVEPGVRIVQAVVGDAHRGDYEFMLIIAHPTGQGVLMQFSAYTKNDAGEMDWIRITREILTSDLHSARLQILGLHTDDPLVIPGATALGPSLTQMRELVTGGEAEGIVRNYYGKRDNAGALKRVAPEPVLFPVLLNGQRVRVPAVHVVGHLGVPGSMRYWDFLLLDHPVHPLTLKVSYGSDNGGPDDDAEWTRQVVRIDLLDIGFGMGTGLADLEQSLAEDCRVEVPGVYFEFDSDQLNPASEPTIRAIGELLTRHPEWTVTIEGHTDNVGGEAYNLDLSNRRAASLKRALVDDHGIAAGRLSTQGFGYSRPVESNNTAEGRARNRRVELVRPCGE